VIAYSWRDDPDKRKAKQDIKTTDPEVFFSKKDKDEDKEGRKRKSSTSNSNTNSKRAKTETHEKAEVVEREEATMNNQAIYQWVKANGFSFDYLLQLTIMRQPDLETTIYEPTNDRSRLTVQLAEKDVLKWLPLLEQLKETPSPLLPDDC